MGKWKKKFNNDSQKNIHENFTNKKKEKKKFENPKHIEELEDIYTYPQSSNIVEGFHYEEDGHLVETEFKKIDPKTNKDTNEKVKSDGELTGNFLEGGIDNLNKRLAASSEAQMVDAKSAKNSIIQMGNELDQSFSSLSELQNLGSSLSDVGSDIGNAGSSIGKGMDNAAQNLGSAFKISTSGINSTIADASASVNSVVQVITNVLMIIGQQLKIYRLKFQMFILKSNKYLRQTITRMANALTQNTATQKEIDIFQDQTQKFVILMLVWYFVFNWYYVIFFLEESDNIRWKFKFTGYLKRISKWIYGLFGVGLKPLELFNEIVLSFAKAKDYLYTSVIMILMFLVFYVLVQNNFQMALLKDFFNAMAGRAGVSMVSLFSMMVVIYFSCEWFFGSLVDEGKTTGFIQMGRLIEDGMKGGSVFVLFFNIVCFVLAFLGYFMWTFSVSVPMSVSLITGYLVLYTFFGVFFYEGFNCFNIFIGITDSLDSIPPDLTPEACQPSSPFLSLRWFYETAVYIVEMLGRFANFASVNMFEFIIILTLIGGLGVYRNEWTSATAGKSGGTIFQSQNLSDVFKNLFVWLILINIGIIIFMSSRLLKKWNLQFSSIDDMSQDFSKQMQTSRSRLDGRRDSVKATSSSKINKFKNLLKSKTGSQDPSQQIEDNTKRVQDEEEEREKEQLDSENNEVSEDSEKEESETGESEIGESETGESETGETQEETETKEQVPAPAPAPAPGEE